MKENESIQWEPPTNEAQNINIDSPKNKPDENGAEKKIGIVQEWKEKTRIESEWTHRTQNEKTKQNKEREQAQIDGKRPRS